MSGRGATRLACALALSSLAVASHAQAHLGHIVVSAERYLKIDASEADTRLVVSLTLGETEGRRVLEAADVDRDGEVTQGEADAYLAEWGRGLHDELPVEVDGASVEVAFSEPFLDPIGRVRAVAVTVEMVAHLPVTSREARITVRDQMVRRESYDRTEVAFRAHDGAEVIAAGEGVEPTSRELDLAFGRTAGRAMPDAITLRALYASRSEPSSVPWLPLGAVALLGVGVGVYVRRRR
jgi:hypothetical protein